MKNPSKIPVPNKFFFNRLVVSKKLLFFVLFMPLFLFLSMPQLVHSQDTQQELWQAINKKSLAAVTKAIGYGADINAQDSQGRTAIMLAAQAANWKIYQYILKRNPDLTIRDRQGNYLAHYLAQGSNFYFVRDAVKANMDFTLKNNAGDTPVILAIQNKQYRNLSYLVSAKAALDTPGKDGLPPIWIAANMGLKKYVKLLLTANVDVNSKNRQNQTLLHAAAQHNDFATAKTLIAQKIDVNARDQQGKTALILAAENNHKWLIKLLLDSGADTTIKDNLSRTVIHYLAQGSYPNFIALAKKQGALLDVKDREGNTPLLLAIAADKHPAALYLLKNGANPNILDSSKHHPVFLAYRKNAWKILEYLFQYKANPNVSTDQGQSVFIEILTKDKVKWRNYYAKLFLENGANPNQKDRQGNTALNIALDKNYAKIIGYLLNAKADTNLASQNGQKPIEMAVLKAYHWHIANFVKAGADVNTVNKEGKSLLQVANELILQKMNQYRWKTFIELINNGANVNVQTSFQKSLLLTHIEKGWLSSVSLILEKGGNIHDKDQDGNGPLHLAAMSGNTKVMATVLEKITQINAKGKNGYTPLLFAVKNAHYQATALLLSKGANIDHRANTGETALDIAVSSLNKSIAQLLINKGASVKGVNGYGNSVLMETIKSAFKPNKKVLAIIQMLLAGKADINFMNKYGNTALTYAIAKKSPELVDLLLKKGANPNLKDKNGYNAMHKTIYSALYGRLKNDELVQIVESLILYGAQINAKDNNGSTPLIQAAKGGPGRDANAAFQAMEILINYSVDISLRDNDGQDALAYARQQNNTAMVHLLSKDQENLSFASGFVVSQLGSGIEKLDMYIDDQNSVYLLLKQGQQISIRKYNASGSLLWQKKIQDGKRIAVSPDKSIYTLSAAPGEINNRVDRRCKKGSNLVVTLRKYDSSGNELWSQTNGSYGACQKTDVYDLVVHDDGTVYIGFTYKAPNNNFFYDYNAEGKREKKGANVWGDWNRMKLNREGGIIYLYGGNTLFRYNVKGYKKGVYKLRPAQSVTHYTIDSDADDKKNEKYYGTGIVKNEKQIGFWIGKFNYWGSPEWTRHLGSHKKDKPRFVAVSSDNYFYVVGTTTGSMHGNQNAGREDIFIIKMDKNGTRQWTRQVGSTGIDQPLDARTDKQGNIVVIGQFAGAFQGNASGTVLFKMNNRGQLMR